MKLFAVDEHEIFCRGIVACLVALPDVTSVGSAGSAAAALDQPELHAADVAIIDPAMSDGLSLMRTLSRGDGPALIGASSAARRTSAGLDRAGATGFVDRVTLDARVARRERARGRAGRRRDGAELLGTLLRGVARARRGVDASPAALALNEREQQVLRLVADGHQTREVAAALCYSERTIKNVIHDAVMKLNVRTRSQAVALAVRQGTI